MTLADGQVCRTERVGKKSVEDVGKQKFLVLFLVMNAKLDPLQRFRFGVTLQQLLDCFIDVGTKAQNFFKRGT